MRLFQSLNSIYKTEKWGRQKHKIWKKRPKPRTKSSSLHCYNHKQCHFQHIGLKNKKDISDRDQSVHQSV